MASDGLIHQFLSSAIAGRTGFTYVDFDPDPSGVDQRLGISEDYWIGDWDGDGLDDLIQYLPFSLFDPTDSDRLEVWRSQGDGTFTHHSYTELQNQARPSDPSGYPGWYFDDHMRQIPDHYHLHARPYPRWLPRALRS